MKPFQTLPPGYFETWHVILFIGSFEGYLDSFAFSDHYCVCLNLN